MFQLTPADSEIISSQNIVYRMSISEKDPFMNKPKPVWKPFHKPIATTDELMGSLEPYDSRKRVETSYLERFTDQERRYYRPEEEVKAMANFNQL